VTKRWRGPVDNVESRRSTYRVLVGKLEEKRPLGRYGHGI